MPLVPCERHEPNTWNAADILPAVVRQHPQHHYGLTTADRQAANLTVSHWLVRQLQCATDRLSKLSRNCFVEFGINSPVPQSRTTA